MAMEAGARAAAVRAREVVARAREVVARAVVARAAGGAQVVEMALQ